MDERPTTDGGPPAGLLDRVLVPVASPEDAATTADALEPYVDQIGAIVALHVVEKAGGAPDKLPVEAAEAYGEEALTAFESRLAPGVDVETRRRFGVDVVETIVEAAHDARATAVAFVPREGGLLVRVLTGDRTAKLVRESDLPVVVFPSTDGTD